MPMRQWAQIQEMLLKIANECAQSSGSRPSQVAWKGLSSVGSEHRIIRLITSLGRLLPSADLPHLKEAKTPLKILDN